MRVLRKTILVFPAIILLGLAVKLFFEMPDDQNQIYKKGMISSRNMHRKISSEPITANLEVSIKKINQVFVYDQGEKLLDNEGVRRNIETLRSIYFDQDQPKLNNDENSKKIQQLFDHVSKNKKIYNEIISNELDNSILESNNISMAQLFSLSASLPLGESPLYNAAENIIIDFANMNRSWDEALFRSTLQFYYIQSLIKEENNCNPLEDFLKDCPDLELRYKIMRIDKEINIYHPCSKVVK